MVLASHLLRQKAPAGRENPRDFPRSIGGMAIDHGLKATIEKGQARVRGYTAEVHA
jgi:hypothetical protein